MKQQYRGNCTNCGAQLKKQHVFQGVIICEDCFKMVSHALQKTQNELKMLVTVYTDMIRAALVQGKFRPPPAVPAGEMMPPMELSRAFDRLAKRTGVSDAQATSEGEVQELRDGDDCLDGEVQRGGCADALSGRR
jgi:hypothetical protein